ncbi:uncharacterized protein BJ212DRAFT_1444172 [Suillus subaureus]|uniref:Proteasome activator complex subunit 4 C-terminal domain-containing protein n=1 Tax=Suillus subaureus TaxID=48587 RepID=A0A9P7EMR3_9AGAM|nr:uncharacterized protein BJ212DRAFT_1444172 [Suillus subaureus]KAG1826229.1 hypothetical protein BJ212DRAFT_1444172 [Suillus subaureus]
MTIIPDVSRLALDDPGPEILQTQIPDDINRSTDRYMQKLKLYAKSIPYAIESNARMQDMLDFILRRIAQCVEAKDFEPGLVQWDSMITYWNMLKYPFPKEKRIRLAKLYFHVATTPGMPTQAMAVCADGLSNLTRSKKKLSIDDMRLPWKPIYNILQEDLFLTRRQFEYSQLSWCMGYIADISRRFFHPAAIEEMLSTFLPGFNGTNLDSVLSSQYYLLTFLPLTHPQSYLPMLCRLWESINSYMYDERMLQFLSRLAEMHVDPTISDPARIYDILDDEKSEDEGRPKWKQDDYHAGQTWSGLYKEVGIFTEHEWHLIMCKCLASMAISLKDGGSLTTGPTADSSSSFEIRRLPQASWRISSLAKLIVYSMAPDGASAPPSTASTPWYTPMTSGVSTPQVSGSVGEYLTVPLHKWEPPKLYLGGSKALDSLARLIASTEHFFHPTNSGSWTSDLTAFVKYIVYEFNKRWHEEQLSDCKTPLTRRLTREMKRELVKCLRTVVLLAIFSQDSSTVSNVQSALKSMSCMEPDLVFQPILERAIPSLEALVETQRTLSVIKALSSIVPAIVSREIYYPGAKHLITILHLLVPGIDLLCTTAFLSEVSQYIMFGDVTSSKDSEASGVDISPGQITDDSLEDTMELKLSNEAEDALLKDSTGSFASWVASLIHRVIQLLENLPEEGPDGSAGGTTEVQVVDAVTGACSQICVHLSDPLFDLVLNMIFDYASTNVRSNAVRAIHQLVECIANAHPKKTLAKFLPSIEHGASSVRTTSPSLPLPSDATLHWNLAILRGCVYKCLLEYKGELLSLLTLLRDKTFSKRGYTWSGKLLSSALITLTHTYPIENKFVNPEQWNDEEFQRNHHLYWGKLFEPDEVKITWHVPSAEEIDFSLQLFRELVEPAMTRLDLLLETCNHLSFVREAFTGIPTLFKEFISPDVLQSMLASSDIINEIPEMIASIEPLASGFCLTDPQDARYKYIAKLRRRFGEFLHAASLSLQRQGEENTVDAVQMLIGSIRTYLLEYGDSKDSYYVNCDQYNSEIGVARQYAGQKVWPRAVFVRRARFYHSSRLFWNSIERARGPLENSLLDDVVEWSMWHYPSALPVLYAALQPGTDDDRMKGALWTLNISSFEPTLVPEIIQQLLGCHHNEKLLRGLANFSEPCYLIYDIKNTALDEALHALKSCLSFNESENSITLQAREKRIERTKAVLEIANDNATHWRYAIVAVRVLRTLLRRDTPTSSSHLRLFLEKVRDSNPTMYAQRGIMKALRYIKLRSYCRNPAALALFSPINPLRCHIPIERSQVPIRSSETLDLTRWGPSKVTLRSTHSHRSIYCDTLHQGWLAWSDTLAAYKPPHGLKSTFKWEPSSTEALSCLREIAVDADFWKKLSGHFAEENHESTVVQDHISCVKSIFQVLGDEPWDLLKPKLEMLLADQDKNKQRAAAELLAGVLNGSKHWPQETQDRIWQWFTPYIKKTLGQSMKTETVPIWTSFVEYMFHHKDPRRLQPLVEHIVEQFKSMDYNGPSSLESIKVLALFRAFYTELGWKFTSWSDSTMERFWQEVHSEHDDVRSHVAEMMAFCNGIKWQPKPTSLDVEAFVRECREVTDDADIMGICGTYHTSRVLELVDNFKVWREQRLPGVRAHQSTYDRVGIVVCRWLYLSVHSTDAISAFDYILPLMPELFRFTEVHDNEELVRHANVLLVCMCGVAPPRSMIGPLLSAIFSAIQTSPSWKVRLRALPILQVLYFRQLPLISESEVNEILDVLCKCLDDEVVEVREMVGTTLSGILRLSSRRRVVTLKDRFVKLAGKIQLPDRVSPVYNAAVRQRHAAVIGICALIDSFPYTIEKWMPGLLTTVMLEHTHDPIPISTTIHRCASNFRKTHQDTWHEDSRRFTDDQLAALSTLLTGSSYYHDRANLIDVEYLHIELYRSRLEKANSNTPYTTKFSRP